MSDNLLAANHAGGAAEVGWGHQRSKWEKPQHCLNVTKASPGPNTQVIPSRPPTEVFPHCTLPDAETLQPGDPDSEFLFHGQPSVPSVSPGSRGGYTIDVLLLRCDRPRGLHPAMSVYIAISPVSKYIFPFVISSSKQPLCNQVW